MNLIVRTWNWLVELFLLIWLDTDNEIEVDVCDTIRAKRMTPIHGLLYASGNPPSYQYDASAIPHLPRMRAPEITLPSITIDENTMPKPFDIPSQEIQ